MIRDWKSGAPLHVLDPRGFPSAPVFGFATCLLILGACSGDVSHAHSDGDSDQAGLGGEGESPLGERPGQDTSPDALIPSRVWRLTYQQYDNTISALLGKEVRPTSELDFPLPPESHGWLNQAEALEVQDHMAALFAKSAERYAPDIAGTLPACGAADLDCVRRLVGDFGKRAWRRPLTDEEIDLYGALFGKVAAEYDAAAALATTVEAFLRSPFFLFRIEAGDAARPVGHGNLLTAYELASALSYGLWNRPPDDELMALADEGRLLERDVYAQQVQRLADDPRAKQVFVDFVGQWLGVHDVERVEKSDPRWSAETAAALAAEYRSVTEAIFDEEETRMERLLTVDYSFPPPALSWIHVGDADGGRAPLTDRRGLLLSPAFLAKQAGPSATNPSRRGAFVVERVACFSTPPPPETLEVAPPPPDPDRTTRENFEEHRDNPACANCHGLFDPVGMALEAYDAVGRHRTEENGRPIRTDAILAPGVVGDEALAFDDAIDMVEKLAAHPAVHACMARQVFQHLLGHQWQGDRESFFTQATRALVDHGMGWRALVAWMASHEQFAVRRPAND